MTNISMESCATLWIYIYIRFNPWSQRIYRARTDEYNDKTIFYGTQYIYIRSLTHNKINQAKEIETK